MCARKPRHLERSVIWNEGEGVGLEGKGTVRSTVGLEVCHLEAKRETFDSGRAVVYSLWESNSLAVEL